MAALSFLLQSVKPLNLTSSLGPPNFSSNFTCQSFFKVEMVLASVQFFVLVLAMAVGGFSTIKSEPLASSLIGSSVLPFFDFQSPASRVSPVKASHNSGTLPETRKETLIVLLTAC